MAFAVQIAKGIFDLLRDDLALVEREIAAQSAVAIEPLAEIASYLREGGGKRLRPALLLLSAGAAGARRCNRRRADATRTSEHERTLGQPHERASGRLAVHAVLRDGPARTQFRH